MQEIAWASSTFGERANTDFSFDNDRDAGHHGPLAQRPIASPLAHNQNVESVNDAMKNNEMNFNQRQGRKEQ